MDFWVSIFCYIKLRPDFLICWKKCVLTLVLTGGNFPDFKRKQAGAELGQAQPELGLENKVLGCGLIFKADA